MLSRIAGFVRDMIFALTFGTSMGMEAFLVAFKIPNFMRRLFAEGSFSQAFVPVLSEYKSQGTHQQTVDFIRRVAGTLGSVLLVLTALGMLGAGGWIMVFAPGFYQQPAKFALASEMLTLTFPYILCIALTALAGSVMNCYERFAVPAFTPVILNLCLISFALGAQYFAVPIFALAWGVLVAGILQLLFQLPFLLRLRVLAWPRPGFRHPGVKKLLSLMVPALFGASVAQISLLLDTIFASFLPTGSISWLYYADRLNQFPLGVLGVALATVVLPPLSRAHADTNQSGYNATLNWALQMVFLFALPAAVGLFVLSGPMIATLFYHGAFRMTDVYAARQALAAFSAGLFTFIMVKVLVSAFYARQNMKTPVKIAVVALLTNMILNGLLMWLLMPYRLGHMGLALATVLASFVNAGCLFVILLRDGCFQFEPGWRLFLLRVSGACVVMAVLLYGLGQDMHAWGAASILTRAWWLAGAIIAGVLSYFGSLYAFGFRISDLKPAYGSS